MHKKQVQNFVNIFLKINSCATVTFNMISFTFESRIGENTKRMEIFNPVCGLKIELFHHKWEKLVSFKFENPSWAEGYTAGIFERARNCQRRIQKKREIPPQLEKSVKT